MGTWHRGLVTTSECLLSTFNGISNGKGMGFWFSSTLYEKPNDTRWFRTGLKSGSLKVSIKVSTKCLTKYYSLLINLNQVYNESLKAYKF